MSLFASGPHDSAAAEPTLGQELLRLRKLHGMSLRTLANLLGLRAHSGLVDYERDYRIPSVDLLAEYQRVLHADGDRLVRLHRQAVLSRQSRRVIPLVPVQSDGRRVQAPLRITGIAAADLLRDAAQRARNFAHDAPAHLADELIDQVLDETRTLARAYPRRPTSGLLRELVRAHEQLLALLGRSHAPATAHRLYWFAAVLCGTLAKASLEFGDPAAATTQAHAAFVCAERGDHGGLRGWVRGMQSLIAYWDGRPRRAVRYAQSGAALIAGTTSTVAAWLPACEARGWARLGNADEALRCVEFAERTWERVLPDDLDALGGICRCGRPELSYLLADALSWLPDRIDSVQGYCAEAAAGYRDESAPDWDFGSAICVDVLTALTLLSRGAHHRARTILAPLFEMSVDERMFSIRQSAARVCDALRIPGARHPGMVELRDRLRQFADDEPISGSSTMVALAAEPAALRPPPASP